MGGNDVAATPAGEVFNDAGIGIGDGKTVIAVPMARNAAR
jgi:hypothetical protein